jgi:peptidoglycan hydrolase-like amidase
MALAGASFDAILRHYYTGIQIVSSAGVAPAPPSTR